MHYKITLWKGINIRRHTALKVKIISTMNCSSGWLKRLNNLPLTSSSKYCPKSRWKTYWEIFRCRSLRNRKYHGDIVGFKRLFEPCRLTSLARTCSDRKTPTYGGKALGLVARPSPRLALGLTSPRSRPPQLPPSHSASAMLSLPCLDLEGFLKSEIQFFCGVNCWAGWLKRLNNLPLTTSSKYLLFFKMAW